MCCLEPVTALHHANTADLIKQHGFYVNYTNVKVIQPSESITTPHAMTRLDLAKSWLRILELFEGRLIEDGVIA